jgi:DNA-directed RNA polymerase specialized sigma24 family protein
MVQELVRALKGWPASDKRAVALALVKQLSVSELAEVLAAAHQRIHAEADRRKQGKRVGR